MVRLLIDSMCDMPEAFQKHPKVDMIPLNVIVEERSYRDKVEIHLEEIHAYMRQGIMPGTSQVSPGDFKKRFEAYAEAGDEVLYLAFTSKLSGSCQTGRMILREVQEAYPDLRCIVVDSLQSGGSVGLIAMELIRLLDAGADLPLLADAAEKLKTHAQFYFSVQDLKWLNKGGRVSKGVAVVGDFLKIRPVVYVDQGELNIIGKVRGDKKAVAALVEKVLDKIGDYRDQTIGIAYADPMECQELIVSLQNKLKMAGMPDTAPVPIGTVLAAHLGLRGIGAYFWDERPEVILRDCL